MPQIVWHVGDVIAKLREARRWNQDRLCEAAGVHRTTVVDVEANEPGITRRTYDKIAKALNLTLRELYALVPPPTSIQDRPTDANLLAMKREVDAALATTKRKRKTR